MTMDKIFDSLLARIPNERSGLVADVSTAFGVVTGFRAQVAKIAADPHLSREGRLAKAAEALKAGPADHLRQLADKTRAAKESIATRRANLRTTKPLEDTAIGEQRRRELRDLLRSMSEAERLRLALGGDPEIEDAIAHGHHALSGLTAGLKARVVEKIIESSAGPKLATLDAEERALDEATSAIQVAEQFLNRAVEEAGK
jgi:hypothetical protein